MKRFWEVDFSRGIAIILMIIFNWSFTLNYFNIFTFQSWAYWFLFPRLIASMFLFIAGVSLILSRNRSVFHVKRGLKIFSLGLLITLATWLLFPQEFIVFGILHLIGTSIILAIPLLKFKKLNLFLAFIVIVLGIVLQNMRFDFTWLLWLGFIPQDFRTLDYFPLLPWFGIVLFGIFFGNLLYPKGKRNFRIKDLSRFSPVRFLSLIGRNSLIIYLTHQPALILLLLILGFSFGQ